MSTHGRPRLQVWGVHWGTQLGKYVLTGQLRAKTPVSIWSHPSNQ